MGTYTLKTNHQPRPLFAAADVAPEIRADFAYIDTSAEWDARLFEYRGSWYDVAEFEVAPDDVKALGFDGVQTESAFSAVVVQWFDKDGNHRDDEIVVGYLYW